VLLLYFIIISNLKTVIFHILQYFKLILIREDFKKYLTFVKLGGGVGVCDTPIVKLSRVNKKKSQKFGLKCQFFRGSSDFKKKLGGGGSRGLTNVKLFLSVL
jgi:hypothetical protein